MNEFDAQLQVESEIEAEEFRPSLWAEALLTVDNDLDKAVGIYRILRYRELTESDDHQLDLLSQDELAPASADDSDPLPYAPMESLATDRPSPRKTQRGKHVVTWAIGIATIGFLLGSTSGSWTLSLWAAFVPAFLVALPFMESEEEPESTEMGSERLILGSVVRRVAFAAFAAFVATVFGHWIAILILVILGADPFGPVYFY